MIGFRSALGIVALTVCGLAFAADGEPESDSLAALWQLVRQQQAQIGALQRQLSEVSEQTRNANLRLENQTTEALQIAEATSAYVETIAASETGSASGRTQIGGYGELHYNNLSASDDSRDLEQIDYHRFVLFFGHQFSDRISFFSELELEHSLAGDGAPGEVELEQAYVDFALSDRTNAQAGLFLLPIGIMNETHEPPTFYGVERNDVENILIPSTWWEAGAGLSGYADNGLSWNAAVHSGLAIPTSGSNAFRVRSGRQKVAEALASDLAATVRLRYVPAPGVALAASWHYQADPSQQAGDGLDSGQLLSAHGIWQRGALGLKALYARWDFSGAAVEAAGADRQTGWYVEPSYRFNPGWGVYSRYENLDGARTSDQFDQWELGFNYWPAENVVLKFDYRNRDHDALADRGRDFDGIDIGVGYQF